AARLRHASSRRRRRPAHDPGAARPPIPFDDAGLQTRRTATPTPGLRPGPPAFLDQNAAVRVSAKVDYALRAMAELAAAPAGRLTTAQQLDPAQQIPPKV